jgi:hypothetical protein
MRWDLHLSLVKLQLYCEVSLVFNDEDERQLEEPLVNKTQSMGC